MEDQRLTEAVKKLLDITEKLYTVAENHLIRMAAIQNVLEDSPELPNFHARYAEQVQHLTRGSLGQQVAQQRVAIEPILAEVRKLIR